MWPSDSSRLGPSLGEAREHEAAVALDARDTARIEVFGLLGSKSRG